MNRQFECGGKNAFSRLVEKSSLAWLNGWPRVGAGEQRKRRRGAEGAKGIRVSNQNSVLELSNSGDH